MAIQGISKAVVPVRDQERAKRFWTETVGFALTTDAAYDDQGARWVEVTAPNGSSVLILSASESDRAVFRDHGDGVPTATFFLYADDVQRTYEELSAKGVEFPEPPVQQPWGWWSTFLDSEGNRFTLQQA
ncbi:glyoxalase superfamily protein [Saccharopolyspora antimicrobica]|nr:glyoxalase superfamily protein [Saccharopolyspora antimicrobica]